MNPFSRHIPPLPPGWRAMYEMPVYGKLRRFLFVTPDGLLREHSTRVFKLLRIIDGEIKEEPLAPIGWRYA